MDMECAAVESMIAEVDSEEKKPDDWDDVKDGEQEAPTKYSPAYEGVWEAEKIASTEFEDDDIVYRCNNFGCVDFDLWQVRGGRMFDRLDADCEGAMNSLDWRSRPTGSQ